MATFHLDSTWREREKTEKNVPKKKKLERAKRNKQVRLSRSFLGLHGDPELLEKLQREAGRRSPRGDTSQSGYRTFFEDEAAACDACPCQNMRQEIKKRLQGFLFIYFFATATNFLANRMLRLCFGKYFSNLSNIKKRSKKEVFPL